MDGLIFFRYDLLLGDFEGDMKKVMVFVKFLEIVLIDFKCVKR